MILACGCECGSTVSLIRSFLKKNGYEDWLSVPIVKGKEKSLRMLRGVPQYPEIEMLQNYVKSASKWAVIIGYNDNGCRWADLTHGGEKSKVDASLIIETFAQNS